jgi:protein-disulfide isomerase
MTTDIDTPPTRRRPLAAASLAAVAALVGCQRDDTAIAQKLDAIEQRLGRLEEAASRGMAGRPGAGQQRPGAGQQRPAPRPEATYAVPITGAPIKGNAESAKVTVVEAYEYACPYCEKIRPTMNQILADYGSDVRVVYKNFVVHPQHATTPALAACAAHRQGKFPEMEALIWDKGFSAGRDLSRENMIALARQAGLDVYQFHRDLDGQDCARQVRQDQAELTRVGVSGTPAFYINGRFLSGARPIDQFKALIDEELKKANDRIAKGEATAATYYDTFVVQRGSKALEAN